MAIGIDSVLSSNAATPPPVAIPPTRTPPINPAQARARSGSEQRSNDQSKGSPEFRAELASVAGVPGEVDVLAEVQARRAQRQAAAEKNVRSEKLPAQESTVLAADEGQRLYAAKLAAPKQDVSSTPEETPDEAALPRAMSSEFYQAASRYAERFFSVAGASAKHGESLEISA